MIRILDKVKCCGCEACVQVCPKHCVAFEQDSEGFRYPLVDETKCIDCGLCEKVCPVLNIDEARKPLSSYAALNEMVAVRLLLTHKKVPEFSIAKWCIDIYGKAGIMMALSIPLIFIFKLGAIDGTIIRLLIMGTISLVWIGLIIFFFGLSYNERQFAFPKLKLAR